MGLDDNVLREMIARVLAVAAPERIILFGSAATGQMTRDSDVDLLVLVADASRAREESTRLRAALRGLGIPIDVLVMSRRWFEATKDLVGGLAYPAYHSGRVIYDRP